jgi:hypothetical protein
MLFATVLRCYGGSAVFNKQYIYSVLKYRPPERYSDYAIIIFRTIIFIASCYRTTCFKESGNLFHSVKISLV